MGQSSIYRSAIQSPSEDRLDAYHKIESILEKAGAAGVHKGYFVYTLHWSQIAARITEMNQLGWRIRSETLPQKEWINGIRTQYHLDGKPLEVGPGEDWYVKLKGKPRPGWQPRPFSEKRMAQDDCFVLTPPEPRR